MFVLSKILTLLTFYVFIFLTSKLFMLVIFHTSPLISFSSGTATGYTHNGSNPSPSSDVNTQRPMSIRPRVTSIRVPNISHSPANSTPRSQITPRPGSGSSRSPPRMIITPEALNSAISPTLSQRKVSRVPPPPPLPTVNGNLPIDNLRNSKMNEEFLGMLVYVVLKCV